MNKLKTLLKKERNGNFQQNTRRSNFTFIFSFCSALDFGWCFLSFFFSSFLSVFFSSLLSVFFSSFLSLFFSSFLCLCADLSRSLVADTEGCGVVLLAVNFSDCFDGVSFFFRF